MSAVNSVPRKHRIGIDIDETNQCRLLIKYLSARNIGKSLMFKTGKGYHIHIVKMNRTTKQNIEVRKIIGDCEGRLELDENRINEGLDIITETLFYDKRVKDYISNENLINPLSMPFWSLPR